MQVYGNKYKRHPTPTIFYCGVYLCKRQNAPAADGWRISPASLSYTPQLLATDACNASAWRCSLPRYWVPPCATRWAISHCWLAMWNDKALRYRCGCSNLHLHFLNQQRLRALCLYYSEHIEDFRMPKSLDVLIRSIWLIGTDFA